MTPQSQIAHYRIISKLGEGGMGAVYLATDTKLNREVAIKVLPDALAGDPDYLARFTREAQVLASLNHPNIATIHGVEERALVMELVPGPTLEDKISAGPMALEEVLEIARQIAEALEVAHEKGIIHRDLKPANVKVTPEGVVKVLDFGLAKAAEPAAAVSTVNSPTLTIRATQAGMIMGTAGYMAPEQAAGKPVDKRADIWSFGVVMYEMLSGARLFEGETVAHTLAAVLRDQIVFGKLPATTPPVIRDMVSRCLDRNVKTRLRDIGDVRVAILKHQANPQPAVEAAPQVRRRSLLSPLAGLAAGLALMAGVMMWRAPKPEERPLLSFYTDMGPEAFVAARSTAVLSPDGRRVAFPVRQGSARMLATRLLDQQTATVLAGADGASDHFFSYDGQWLGFAAGGKLKKVSVQGGAPVIVSYPEQHGELWHRYLQALPGGANLLVSVFPAGRESDAGPEAATVAVFSLKTGLMRTVVKGGSFGRYVPGYLLYLSQNTVFAAKFDADRGAVTGAAVPVIPGVAATEGSAAALLDVARNGTAVYVSGLGALVPQPVVWVDAGGTRPLIPNPAARLITPRFSPDGKLLAAAVNREIRVFDLERGSSTQLTTRIQAQYPVWTPDGKYIVFQGRPGGLSWVRADGSLPAQVIYQQDAVPQSFTADGRQLLFHQGTAADNNNRQIYVLPLDTTDPEHPKAGTPQIFVSTENADADPMHSPDGHWVAYATSVRRTSAYQVFVRPFPPGAQVQVSVLPGRFPMWSRTGKELFYVTEQGRIQVVPYAVNGQSFVPGKAREWSILAIRMNSVVYPIDIVPNGKSFAASVAADRSEDKTNMHVTFLVNFLDELKRKLP